MISALIAKAKTMDVFTLNRVLDAVLGDVRTNMSKGEFAGFILDAVSYGSYTVEATYHLPQDGAYKGVSVPGVGSSLQLTNPAGAVQELHKYIYGIKKAQAPVFRKSAPFLLLPPRVRD